MAKRPAVCTPVQMRLACSIARRVVAGRGRRLARLIALFTVPAFLMGLGTFTVHALVLSPQQHAQSLMGAADGVIPGYDPRFGAPTDVLATGNGEVTETPVQVRFRQTVFVRGIERGITVWTGDWRRADLRSLWNLEAGRWPMAADEVVLLSTSLHAFDTNIGGTIRMGQLARPLRVVGRAEDPTSFASTALLGPAALGSVLDHTPRNTARGTSAEYLLSGPPAAVARVVAAANRAGIAATSRSQAETVQYRTLFRTQSISVTAPGLLLVVVLSAAAFIVRVRRSGRQLSVLLALGISPGTLVTASRLAAVATALIGSMLGVAASAAVAFALRPALASGAGHELATRHLSTSSALLTVGLVAATAVVAAWLPARAARRGVARFDGSPPPRRTRPIAVAVAVLVTLAGAALGLAAHDRPTLAITVSIVLVATVCLVPAGLSALSRLTHSGPAVTRIAARALARDVRRPAAAVAIGMVVLTGAIGSLTYYSSLRAIDRAADEGSTHAGEASLPLRRVGVTPSLVADLRAASGHGAVVGLRSELRPASEPVPADRFSLSVYEVHSVDGRPVSGQVDAVQSKDDFYGIVGRWPSESEWHTLQASTLLQLNGSDDAQVTLDVPPRYPTNARVTIVHSGHFYAARTVGTPIYVGPPISAAAQPSDPVHDSKHLDATLLAGPGFVAAHRLATFTSYINVSTPGQIDPSLGDKVRAVAERHGIAASEVIFHDGGLPPLPFDYRLVLVTSFVLVFIAVGIATLAMSEDARPFYQSLFSLGFSSRRQRAILATQAGLLALLAAVLGTVIGLIAGVASVHALGVGASVTWATPLILLLFAGCIAGAIALGLAMRGQRSIDELSS